MLSHKLNLLLPGEWYKHDDLLQKICDLSDKLDKNIAVVFL